MKARGLWALGLVLALSAACADRERPVLADGLLMVEPRSLDFGAVPIFQQVEQPVRLVNGGRGRLVIHDAWMEAEDGSYLAEFTHDGPHNLIAGGTCDLNVRFAPTRAGLKPAYLVIRTDGTLAPLMKIPVTGEAIDISLSLSDGALDFGRIELDDEKTLSFSYRNPSTLPIEVRPELIGADADEFHTLRHFTLAPGEERIEKVRFAPKRVGLKHAAIAVSPCKGCLDAVIVLRAVGLEQAVIAVPPDLDMGQVPIDRNTQAQATVKNISTETRTLLSLQLAPGTDPSFTHDPEGFPLTLLPDEERSFTVRYSPGHMGEASGGLQVGVDSKRHPTTDFTVRAFGGSPELCVSPISHDFGLQPVGSVSSVNVTLRNCGSQNGKPLEITELRLEPSQAGGSGEDQFRLSGLSLPIRLQAGEEVTGKMFFEPKRGGPASANLRIRSTGFGAAQLAFPYSGAGEVHAPCNLVVTPQEVDFGTLPPEQGAVLGVKMRNGGTELCALRNIRLAYDGGGVFSLPGGAIESLLVYPGDYFSMMVAYRPLPGVSGSRTGILQVELSNPANPMMQIPLRANTQASCLVATPPYLDFGDARPDCPPPTMKVRLENGCARPIHVARVFIGAGTTDGEFLIESGPSSAFTLQPASSFSVEVRYLAQVGGMNLSPLFVDAEDVARPLMVTLLGESSLKGNQTDVFTQQDGSKVDVLFVVDNTASMIEEHPKLVSAIPSFVNAAKARGVDMNVAVTTTGIAAASPSCPGGAQGGEAGRLFPADSSSTRILNAAMSDLATRMQRNVEVGRCAYVEQGFEAVRRALTTPLVDRADDPRTPLANDGNAGFLRAEAALTVVFVSDEDDHSPDDVETYAQFLRNAKGMYQPQRVTAFAIAPTAAACATAGGAGTRYAQLAQKTGGEVMSICASDYGPLLQNVANRAFSVQALFPLSKLPDATTLKVTVDGVERGSGWSYDAATNSISFSPLPNPGARISITYRRACA